MKNYARLLMFLIGIMSLLVVVSACGHRDNRAEENPYARISKTDMKYQNIQIVNFTISPRGVQETDNPQGVLKESQEICAQVLTESKLFNNVRAVNSAERESSALIIQGELTKLRIVGGGARFWIGAMAGKSEMSVYVKLIDASTGQVISQQQVNENSDPSTGAWSIGATDRALPRTVGSLIADFAINSARR